VITPFVLPNPESCEPVDRYVLRMAEAFEQWANTMTRDDVTLLHVKPGDVVVVDLAYRPSHQEAMLIRQMWGRCLPDGCDVVVTFGHREITVLEPGELEVDPE